VQTLSVRHSTYAALTRHRLTLAIDRHLWNTQHGFRTYRSTLQPIRNPALWTTTKRLEPNHQTSRRNFLKPPPDCRSQKHVSPLQAPYTKIRELEADRQQQSSGRTIRKPSQSCNKETPPTPLGVACGHSNCSDWSRLRALQPLSSLRAHNQPHPPTPHLESLAGTPTAQQPTGTPGVAYGHSNRSAAYGHTWSRLRALQLLSKKRGAKTLP
jgi:hypothetical protein